MRNFYQTLCIVVLGAGPAFLTSFGYAADSTVNRESLLMLVQGSAPSSDLVDYQIGAVPGQSGGVPTMVDQRETGRFIVSKSPTDTWWLNERFGHFGLSEPIAIPQTQDSVPEDLWSLDGGIGYHHLFNKGRSLGFNFNVGSESDHLFYSIHETAFRALANYRVPSGDHNAWLFSLSYSNNRHFLNGVPLPGVGYYFQALEDRFEGLIGFPFIALRYRPTPDWNAALAIFGPRNVNAEVGRKVVRSVRAYTGFVWGSQEWMVADRKDYSNRLFFVKKSVALGLRSPVAGGLMLDVSGGRQFDQRFFVNDSSSYKDVPTAGLPPAWFGQIKLSYRFAVQPL